EAGSDIPYLETLAQHIEQEAPTTVLTWLVAMLVTVELVDEIEQSTSRISNLVTDIREYTYMDQAPLQEVDVHAGLESTLTILEYKLKEGLSVSRIYDRDLPRILAYGSELNQVWTNLIDNAIDAMDGQERLTLRTSR